MTLTFSVCKGDIFLPGVEAVQAASLYGYLGGLVYDGEHIYKMVKLVLDKTTDGPCALSLVDGSYRVAPWGVTEKTDEECVWYWCDHEATLPKGTIFWVRCE